MSLYLGRRLLAVVPVLALVLVMVFGLTRLIPGDPAVTLLGPGATNAQLNALRHQLHLDEPEARQFLSYVGGLAHGDFGTSLKTGQPISRALATRLPATIELSVTALLMALAVGIPFGVWAARRPEGPLDQALRLVALAGVSVPAFLLALGLQYAFGVWLGWLPVAGRTDPWEIRTGITGFVMLDAVLEGDGSALWDAIRHVLLPASVLASFLAATLSRFVRNTMIATMTSDYIRTARAKGLQERAVIVRHALRNAILPAVTVIGLQFGDMLGGAILTETVFSWPGLGRYTFEAIRNRDYPAIQGATLVFALMFVLTSLLVDLIALRLDPRLRRQSR
ncbi:ABC transporter permease [Lichenicola cladoniae]|nr:ABC transporter permease [Lichenicola cladoniae]